MRLVSFNKADKPAVGIEIEEFIIDLSIADVSLPKDMASILTLDVENLRKIIASAPSNSLIKKDQIELLPPIPNPGKIICVGLNYNDHIAETKREKPKYPVFFARFNSTFVAHNKSIIRPVCSSKIDYEGELVVVIGQKAKYIKKEDANKVIAGYSIFNDVTVRDYQGRTSQWLLGKNFDNCGAFGPCIVTKDEFIDGLPDLRIRTILNGQVMQEDSTSNMIFSVHELIEYITEAITLEAGDIIVTGTPSGVGYTRNPPVYLKDGDICEVEIESIGKLRNVIKDEKINL